jgi:6,7-dimethyl-8-ribityllumazine synthase
VTLAVSDPAVTHRLPRVPEPTAAADAGRLVGSHEGHGVRVAVACARFNEEITRRLLEGAEEALSRLGVSNAHDRPLVCWVPGAFELPLAALSLAAAGRADAVVALGCVIRGETSHYEFVAGECAAGLQRVQLDTGVPVVFGVLTTETLEQALERSGGSLGNKGAEAVETAVEMVNLLRAIGAGKQSPGGARAAAAPGNDRQQAAT